MKKYISAARLFAIQGSILPALMGAVFAYSVTGKINILLMILTALGVGFIHTGANFINDYFDHLTQADEKNTEGIFPFSGGSRVIQNGIIPANRIRLAAIVCFSVGTAIGVYLYFVSGFWVLIFGATGVLSCILYVSPRFSLTNIGLGEVAVGFNLGFLDVMGSYYVQTSQISFNSFMLAIPIAITTTLILYINEFPDYNGDLLAGKRNAIVRLGRKKASRLLVILLALIVITIIVNVIFGFLSAWSLISLLSLPFFIYGAKVALKHYDYMPNFIPGTVSVLNINTFVNLLFIVSFLAAIGNWVWFCILTPLVVAYEIKALVDIAKLKDSQFIAELKVRFREPSGITKNL
jgi:1,4-dihydroxy-2-naphthoate octaprenyltransferase